MLELRPGCECCDRDLPPESPDALICSFECTFCRDCAQSRQKVHSKEQISASGLSGGRSRSQHSQPGRSSSMVVLRGVQAKRSA